MAGADLFAVAGSKIFIGGVLNTKNGDFTEADFASQTWIEIDGWKTMGAFGDTAEEINVPLINRGRNSKMKGTRDAGNMENVFAVIGGDLGQAALIGAEKSRSNRAFKIQHSNAVDARSATVTMTIASPGVITWNSHGLTAGVPIVFASTGALPSGITSGVTYYVIAAGLTANSFQIAATPGGAAIVTTGTQSGVHTASTAPAGTLNYFVALIMSVQKAGGEANTDQTLISSLSINSNIVEVAAVG